MTAKPIKLKNITRNLGVTDSKTLKSKTSLRIEIIKQSILFNNIKRYLTTTLPVQLMRITEVMVSSFVIWNALNLFGFIQLTPLTFFQSITIYLIISEIEFRTKTITR